MKKTKQCCSGCRDNLYNVNEKDGCWSFKSARVVKRKMIPLDQCPPFKMPTESVLSCYRRPGYATVDPKSLTKDGFWKS